MASAPISSVVIVGGGTAGWMSAAALARMLDVKKVSVTLVESESIGTVGVGEATIPNFTEFNQVLGLDEREMMAQTHATFKLGIEFSGWGREGESYLHPFSPHGFSFDGIPFHQYWKRMQENAPETLPIDKYCLSTLAAKAGRFAMPAQDPRDVLSRLAYAYQLDATSYAAVLRRYAEKRGVKRVEGKVVDVPLEPETGFIKKVVLQDGTEICADLFIDCTGFRGLLIGDAMGVGFVDWTKYLPCNRAVTAPSAHTGPLMPYTISTAQKAGWQWRIPLQHRIGNGHVYSSAHMSDDEATKILLENMDGEPLSDPRTLRWTNGHREKIWHKNCVAIGLSAGFLEPLESTGIYLIQSGVIRLLSLFPDTSFNQVEIDEFNTLAALDIEQVRDFIITHYVVNQREGQPFWDHMRSMDIPETLQRKLDLFKRGGRFFRNEGELFTQTSWVAIMLGQNLVPEVHDPLVDRSPISELSKNFTSISKGLEDVVSKMPKHEDFIAQYCKGGA